MYSDDEEQLEAVQVYKLYSVKVPAYNVEKDVPSPNERPIPGQPKPKSRVITCMFFDPEVKRMYVGLESGDVIFWNITKEGTSSHKYVGQHKGTISSIYVPAKNEGEAGAAKLILTGSYDSTIKVWDYQGKLIHSPSTCVQTLYGHGGTVTATTVLGNYIISSSTDCTIRMWRAVEGREHLNYPWYELQGTIVTMEGWVRCMTYQKSDIENDLGALYAADDKGHIIKIVPQGVINPDTKRWSNRFNFQVEGRLPSTTGGPPLAFRKIHDRGIHFLKYHPGASLLFTLAYDNNARIYDTQAGVLKQAWDNENSCQFHGLEYDAQSNEVLLVDKLGFLSIYSLRTGQLNATKHLGSEPLSAIVCCLGKEIYAVAAATSWSLWQVDRELDHNVVRGGHTGAVISLYTCSGGVGVKASEVDFRIFSAGQDNTVRLWDPYDLACVRVMEESGAEITAMTFFEAWNVLITGHDNGDIRVWSIDTSSSCTLKQHTNTVTSLVLAIIHRNEELLVSAAHDGWVCLWDVRQRGGERPHMVSKFRAHGPDPRRQLTLSSSVTSHRTATESVAPSGGSTPKPAPSVGQARGSTSLSAPTTPLSSTPAATSPACLTPAKGSPKVSLSGSSLSSNMAAGEPASTAQQPAAASSLLSILNSGSEPEVQCLVYDPRKQVLATGGNDKLIKVWSATSLDFLGCHRGHSDAVICLQLDANFLFSGSEDCNICVWDTVPAHVAQPNGVVPHFQGRPLKRLEGHSRAVTGLEVIPTSGHLVSCSRDGRLLFWDYVLGQVLWKYEHTEEFRCLALRYDMDEVLVGTMQANILRYPVGEPLGAGAKRLV